MELHQINHSSLLVSSECNVDFDYIIVGTSCINEIGDINDYIQFLKEKGYKGNILVDGMLDPNGNFEHLIVYFDGDHFYKLGAKRQVLKSVTRNFIYHVRRKKGYGAK